MELSQIMRQQKDKPFAEMLNMVRTGEHAREYIELLQTMCVDEYLVPFDILHVFPFNA